MAALADTEPATSGSKTSLSTMFKSRRQRKTNTSSAPSVASSDSGSRRLSIHLDNALDKMLSRTSVEETNPGAEDDSSGLGRLIERVNSKRRRRRERSLTDEAGLDAANTLSTQIYDAEGNASSSSLLHRSVASSLLTEDELSDRDEDRQARPSLRTHDSHAGYLTVTSPEISSATVPTDSDTLDPSAIPPLDDTLAPRHAKTLEPAPAAAAGRSPSPVNKLREAFVPAKRASTAKHDSDKDSNKSSSAAGGGLGGLFGAKKAGFGGRRARTPSEDRAESPEKPAEERGRPTTLARLNTDPPATPPNRVDAPTTLVTPPTPTDSRPVALQTPERKTPDPSSSHRSIASNPAIVTSPSGTMISHRRARSATNPPSKLSNSITAPLSPTIEEAKTPGGGFSTPPAGGFFSSAFSAIQNATTSLSNTITSSTTPKGNRGPLSGDDDPEKKDRTGGEEVILSPEGQNGSKEDVRSPRKRLAVETLGSGDLSLSHLGISESSDVSPTMASKTDLSEGAVAYDNASAKAEDNAAAQAVSAAYANDKTPVVAQEFTDPPRSLTGFSGTMTPPRTQSNGPDPSSIKRSGSIRSRVSGGRRRRHRGSSATTGNTIAAAISASTATLTNPSAPVAGPKLTGFAVASPKRNRDFHQLFRSVPEDDYLIEDYSAALQRDILLQGRLYVSEGHVCFSSNILGWVTNLVISFDEVVSVEKKNTAVIFPNAIVIQTLHARNVFASFVTRDSTYDLLIGIWKISHPNLKSSLNGVTLDAGTGDKTEKAESVHTEEDGSEEGSDEEVYDEDEEEEEGAESFVEAGEGSIAGSEVAAEMKSVSRKTSAALGGGEKSQNGAVKASDPAEVSAAPGGQDFPGPATHGPTECGDQASHYEKELTDTVIAAPLGKIYSLMFGPASGVFMRKWLLEDQKSMELQMDDDKQGLGENKKTFTYSFIKPLNASIGPRQTKCNITQTLEQFDLEKAVVVSCATQTPDVPSGNIFLTKTKYCLMWAPGNQTRLIMSCMIEWSGKSWLKGPIEKGANDGQIQYAKDITAALRGALVSKTAAKGAGVRGKGKGKKKKESSELASASAGLEIAASAQQKQKESDWGLFEPLHPILGPFLGMLKTLLNMPVVAAIVSLLIVYMWLFRTPSSQVAGFGFPGTAGISAQQRIALYEEMWKREESELWNWLEERVSMDRAHRGAAESRGSVWGRKKDVEDIQVRLGSEEMTERQIDEAIRITQDKLNVLREAVERRKKET